MMKRLWWNAPEDARRFSLWLLANIPTLVGIRLRSLLMPLFLQSLGKDTTFHRGFVITNPESVSIGSNCAFGRGMFVTGGGGVRIGDWVGFGPDVKVWSVNHRYDDPERPWRLQGWNRKPVDIEDDVWLGANVFVMPGVKIGRGAIISAASVIAKSVPPFAVVAGNPGRIIGWRKRPAGDPQTGHGEPESGRYEHSSGEIAGEVDSENGSESIPMATGMQKSGRQVSRCSAAVELQEHIRGFILANFLFSQDTAALGLDESLSARGIVDSAGILELVLFIEDELGVKIQHEELVRENLDTVAKIAAFVQLKRRVA